MKKFNLFLQGLDSKYINIFATILFMFNFVYLGVASWIDFNYDNSWFSSQPFVIFGILFLLSLFLMIGVYKGTRMYNAFLYTIFSSFILLYYGSFFQTTVAERQITYFEGFFTIKSWYFLLMIGAGVGIFSYVKRWRSNFLIGAWLGFWILITLQYFVFNPNDSTIGKLVYAFGYAGLENTLKHTWLLLLLGFFATRIGLGKPYETQPFPQHEIHYQFSTPQQKQQPQQPRQPQQPVQRRENKPVQEQKNEPKKSRFEETKESKKSNTDNNDLF